MTQATSPVETGLFARMFSWLLAHHVREGEIATLSRGDITSLAADLGVSETDLMTALPAGTDKRDLMDQMIRAYGLDPTVIRSLTPALVRDLEMTCARCGEKGRCARDLKNGVAAARSHAYCGNADAFEALLDARQRG